MAKILQRWNYEKGDYEPFEVPDDRNCATFRSDMGDVVDCASCGESHAFGSMYTSREIHTESGIAYSVCLACYTEERIRERRARE